MRLELREQAVSLRIGKEMSYGGIRKRLGVPKSTLSYWLREYPLSEEKILELRRKGWKSGEASRERFRTTMRKKRELKDREVYQRYRVKFVNLSEEVFFTAGLMLYLGEGDKKNNYRIGIANTDPWVIKFFIKWLIDFLGVTKEQIRAQLHLYENMDIEQEKSFWKKALGLSDTQLYKTEIRKLKTNSFSYRESYRHGTCSLFVLGVDKKRELMMAIKAFLDLYELR